jgi:hypothetical protein
MNDTILYNDTLRNAKKDSFLVSIDRNGGNQSKRKREYVNEKGCSAIVGTIIIQFHQLDLIFPHIHTT